MNTEYDFSAVAGTAKEKVQNALATARQQTEDAVMRGSDYVRERPAISLGTAFALGFAFGALVMLAARPKPAPRRFLGAESRDRLAELFGTVATNLRGPLEKTRSSVSDGASALSDSVMHALEKVAAKGKSPWW